MKVNKTHGGAARSDALVLFGVTGDLVHKKILPALYAMAKRGVLDVPVVGVAFSSWSLAQLCRRATDSIRNCAASQAIVDKALALAAPIGGHAMP